MTTSNFEMELNNNIARFRKEKGLTQEQLAKVLNVSVAAVSKWENGNNRPDIELLPALAEVFQVSVDALLGYEKMYRNLENNLKEMKTMVAKEQYDEVLERATDLLRRYPNDFYLNHLLAETYYSKCFSGTVISSEKENYKHAVYFYERCMELYDAKIHTETSIEELHIAIATLQAQTSEMRENAIAIIKKYNRNGNYDNMLAGCLYASGRKEEARKMILHHSIAAQVFCFNDFTTLADYYANEQDYETAILFLQAELEQYKLFMKEEASYANRAYAGKAYIISCLYGKLGDEIQKAEWLEVAKIQAKKYMNNPTMRMDSMKYCEGIEGRMIDNFGETLEKLVADSLTKKC